MNLTLNEICVNYLNENASATIKEALLRSCQGCQSVTIVFIGTDANVGDSLAPMAGSLTFSGGAQIFTYGNLNTPITAKDVPFITEFVKNAHPQSKTIAIDAAVGSKEDLGSIKILQKSIRPGLGVNKNLPPIGDVSIIGVVAERSKSTFSALGYAKISGVYAMAKVIADGINGFIKARTLKRDDNANYFDIKSTLKAI